MKGPKGMKQKLLESTIKVIGNNGIEKATTKAICKDAELNEVYIYRLYGSKEQLFIDVYSFLDEEFVNSLLKNFDILVDDSLDNNTKWKKYVYEILEFILGNYDKAMTYIYYYYSKYYSSYPVAKRAVRYKKAYEKFGGLILKEDVNIGELFSQLLDIVFTSVLKVFRGEEDKEVMKKRVYKLIYVIIKDYLKD